MQQLPSPDARLEVNARDVELVLSTAAQLQSFDMFGIVELDEELIARARYGSVVSFVECGRPAAESLPALFGLEDEIRDMRGDPCRAIEVPAISMANGDGPKEKFDLTFFWSPPRQAYIGLMCRTTSLTKLEEELSCQIRARLMLEADREARSKELARTNADLEHFAGIISHDLKAPLRHMRQLAELATDAAGEAGTNAPLRATLSEIQQQAGHMTRMLDQLFEYSSIGRKAEAVEKIDLGLVIDTLMSSLPKTPLELRLAGVWPIVTTLRAPLDVVLRNLITNAVQHHDKKTGWVEVSCAEGRDALTIEVADDGPGIDPSNHHAIFWPFRVLNGHPPASTGMGLAMVRRALDSVGGEIAVASQPAKARGATFIVTWPRTLGL